MKLNIGCGRNAMEGYVNLDSADLPGVDVVADLLEPLPFEDDTFDEIYGSHVIEHISGPDSLKLMEELWRITKNGGTATFETPYGSSDDAWEDPTHVRPLFPNSYSYFSQPNFWRADYGYRGDWQCETVELFLPAALRVQTLLAQSKHIQNERNQVERMTAHLVAIKPIREPLRGLQVPIKVIHR